MPANVPLTDEQKQLIATEYAELRASGMAAQAAQDVVAAKLGISPRTVRNHHRYIENVQDIGEDDPDTKGTSTLYDSDGNVKLKWVKTNKGFDKEQLKEWMTTLAQGLPKVRATDAKGIYGDDTLTVIPFGDPHFGLYSWQAETGDDFDLDIAEGDLCGAVEHLVKSTPKSKECLIVNLGDYFHSDSNAGVTMRSNHKLDTDTRWAKVLLIGLKAIRQCISSALQHHEKVTVINAIGNHDDHSSIFLTVALANIYENEPRINIIDNPTIVHYYHFGKNLIGVHHGHTIKPDQLPLIMATDRPKEWSESTNRMWLCGHIHHLSKKEYQGVTVETFRTLAARDAWSASMGYRAGRDMNAIVLHKEFGEVARFIVSVDMLRRLNEQA